MASPSTVIIGGGIQGCSLAYFLSLKGFKPTIVEKTAIAAAASGKAGGFLAREWGSGPTIQLHQKSYDLHKELAALWNIQSYRQVDTLNVNGNQNGKNVASWLDKQSTSTLMDTNTAQVTPLEFTQKILAEAVKLGAEVITDSVDGIEFRRAGDVKGGGDKVTGIKLRTRGIIPAENVVICSGPWSGVMVEDWFGMHLPMEGVKSTSLVYQDVEAIRREPYACFCAEDKNGCHLEMYPRPNGEIYVCGCGGSDYVRGDRLRENGDCASADLIAADPKRVQAAAASMKGMSSLADRDPDVTQACMRPCTTDALPVMGRIPGVEGAYISAGHNCWGILWAPISGLCMAELIAEGQSKSIDLTSFNPARYMNRRVDGSGRGKKKGGVSIGEQW